MTYKIVMLILVSFLAVGNWAGYLRAEYWKKEAKTAYQRGNVDAYQEMANMVRNGNVILNPNCN